MSVRTASSASSREGRTARDGAAEAPRDRFEFTSLSIRFSPAVPQGSVKGIASVLVD
jgi:hypothetical protein